jgi:hypothetical protein
MEPERYPDPLEEAFHRGSQRAAQFGALVGAMAQVVIQRRALHGARTATRDDERAARILREQERLIHRQSQLSWAPAHDANWLAHADLLQTGRAWAGGAIYDDTDPAAASAMRKCEDRLRRLHPYAMARYDRLRSDGMSPLDAMRETAPLFSRHPHVRVGDPAPPRPPLAASLGPEASPQAGQTPSSTAEPAVEPGSEDRSEQRGQQIIGRLQASARAANRPELGPDELTMILEAVTNLPENMIEKLTREAARKAQADRREQRVTQQSADGALHLAATTAHGEQTTEPPAAHHDAGKPHDAPAQARSDRSAAQLAAQSFPRATIDAVRSAKTGPNNRPARAPVQTPSPDIGKHPNRKL